METFDLSSLSCRRIWLLTWPVMVSLLMQHLIGMTDTAFLGRVGEVELGAAALGSIYYLAVYMIGFGFSIGAQIIMARRNGEGRVAEIGRIFYCGCRFMAALAAGLFLLSYFLTPLVLRPAITSDAVYAETMRYVNWRSLGFFVVFIAVMFRAFFVAVTDTKVLTLSSVVMLLTNVLFNYVLIFGKCGFPVLGVAGAAIASVIAEAAGLVFFVVYTRRRVDAAKYALNVFGRFDWKLLREIMDTSVWTMLQLFIAVGIWFGFFLAVEHLGEQPLAVVNIIRSVSNISFMMFSAFATVTSSLVSNLIGAGHSDQVLKLIRRTAGLAFIGSGAFLVILALFPNPILRIFTDSAVLIDATRETMYAIVINTLIQTGAYIVYNAVSGTGNTRVALLIELIATVVYGVAIYIVVIVLRSSVALCWLCDSTYALTIGLASFLYLWSGRWKNRRI